MSAVTIENLRKHFGGHSVLPGFDLRIEDGEFVVLLGPSGCGKTTILRCLAGLDRPSGGRIAIGNKIVEDVEARIAVPTQNRDLGFVFQNYALWPHMSVAENIAYPLKVRRTPRAEIDREVKEVLALVGLDGQEARAPMELSGGQQQRVALARALIASPRVLLLDEPLSNLDAQRRSTLRKQLRAIHREVRTTTVYVTHDQTEALTMADRVLIMKDGRIEQSGTPRQVFEHPASRFAADFLGYENIIDGVVAAGNGRFITVHSDAWGGEIRVESDHRPAPGTVVDLAFRAVKVSLHAAAPADANPRAMQVRDITYLGDSVEYTLQAGGRNILARLPVSRRDTEDSALGSKRVVAVAPGDIVLLPRGAASSAELSQEDAPARLRA